MLVKFLKLKIENFKSIESMEFDFGDVTKITGANETGKTTIADAIEWVFTGKNSLGNSTFNIVPVGFDGVSPSVELKISIGGKGSGINKRATLKRVHKIKIGRDKKSTGTYQTECYVNGLKYTQRDFGKWIEDNICDPEIFKLLHDVKYFTESIKTNGRETSWEARRRILTDICGLNIDFDIAVNSGRYKEFADRLSEYDDSTQMLNRLKSDIAGVENDLSFVNRNIETLTELYRINEKHENKKDLIEQIKCLKDKYDKIFGAFRREISELSEKTHVILERLKKAKDEVSEINLELISEQARMDSLTENYERYGTSCPTCGRKFSRGFSERKKAEYEEQTSKLKKRIESIKENLEEAKRKEDALEKEYDRIESEKAKQPLYELDDIENMIYEKEEALSVIKRNEELFEDLNKMRIKRDSLSEMLSKLQMEYDICKEFISYKTKIVTEKVNSMFEGIEFVMFKHNVTNDEIRDCCEIKYNGVSYNDLSYSTKFFASLMISLGFQKLYDLSVPIIMDNAESIDLGFEIPGVQMILLEKIDSVCPKCGASVGRKKGYEMWNCKKCGLKFKKKLEVKI